MRRRKQLKQTKKKDKQKKKTHEGRINNEKNYCTGRRKRGR